MGEASRGFNHSELLVLILASKGGNPVDCIRNIWLVLKPKNGNGKSTATFLIFTEGDFLALQEH